MSSLLYSLFADRIWNSLYKRYNSVVVTQRSLLLLFVVGETCLAAPLSREQSYIRAPVSRLSGGTSQYYYAAEICMFVLSNTVCVLVPFISRPQVGLGSVSCKDRFGNYVLKHYVFATLKISSNIGLVLIACRL
jgi:hypothetical protein